MKRWKKRIEIAAAITAACAILIGWAMVCGAFTGLQPEPAVNSCVPAPD